LKIIQSYNSVQGVDEVVINISLLQLIILSMKLACSLSHCSLASSLMHLCVYNRWARACTFDLLDLQLFSPLHFIGCGYITPTRCQDNI